MQWGRGKRCCWYYWKKVKERVAGNGVVVVRENTWELLGRLEG